MDKAYNEIVFHNDQSPDLDEINMNAISHGLSVVDDRVIQLKGDLTQLNNLSITWTDGKYINGSNVEFSNNSYAVSNYIKIFNLNNIFIKMYFEGSARCVFLDKDKRVISNIVPSQSLPYEQITNVPSNAYYFRACTLIRNKADSKIIIDVPSMLDDVLIGHKNIVNSSSVLADANDALTNHIYSITSSTSTANLPTGAGNQQGTLITFAHKNDDNVGKVQIMITAYNNMFFRLYWSNWGGWRELLNHRSMDDLLTAYVSGKGVYSGNDLNTIKINSVYNISSTKYESDLLNCPFYPFQGIVATFGGISNGNIAMQFIITPVDNNLYYRKYWGNWGGWKKLEEQPLSTVNNNGGYEAFTTVGCIGDSLASGECVSNETGTNVYHDIYKYSWGQFMARMSGNTYYNFSKGGLSTRTWLTSEYATQLVDGNHNCQAYIIGLGENDALTDSRHVEVGTVDDINHPERDTYYANYAKIIRLIKSQVPKAKIFVITNPKTNAQFEPYNEAVRAMANAFEDVFVIDLRAKYINDYAGANSIISKSYRQGHYNAYAYGHMAKIIANEISNIMLNNITKFSQIEFIDTDWSWT